MHKFETTAFSAYIIYAVTNETLEIAIISGLKSLHQVKRYGTKIIKT